MDIRECRVAICDDRVEDIARIEEALKKGLKKTGQQVRLFCRKFLDGEALFEVVQKESFHLLLLDIEMPGLDGFQLAERLCMNRHSFYLIFVSVHESFVFDASEYMPLWFVRKSNLERDMFRAVRKYMQITSSIEVNYRIKEGFGFRELPLQDILYIECSGHSLLIWRTDGSCLRKYGSLKAMEEELKEYHFLRIHKNFLANQKYIKEVGKREVYLTDGRVLDMGRDRKMTVREEMLQYERERHGG